MRCFWNGTFPARVELTKSSNGYSESNGEQVGEKWNFRSYEVFERNKQTRWKHEMKFEAPETGALLSCLSDI